MKIADHKDFHYKWEDFQKSLTPILSLAHDEPWVKVEKDYDRAIDTAIVLLKALKLDMKNGKSKNFS